MNNNFKNEATFDVQLGGSIQRKARDKSVAIDMYVVVRHTRSGDVLERIMKSREWAMQKAEQIASDAANNYGHGLTSVFPAKLVIGHILELPQPEQPAGSEK